MKMLLYSSLLLYAVFNLVSMATMSIGAGLVGLAFMAEGIWGGGFKKEWNQLYRNRSIRIFGLVSLLLPLACVLSMVSAYFFPYEVFGHRIPVEFGFGLSKLWYFLWPFVLVLAFLKLTTEHRQTILKTWFIAYMVLSLVGIQQFFTGWPREHQIPGMSGHYHADMFLGWHLSTASIWIFPFFASLDAAFGKFHKTLKWNAQQFLFIAFLGFLVLLFSWARSVWLALPVGLLGYGLWRLPQKKKIIAIISVFVLSLGFFSLPSVQERFLSGAGTGERKALWEANWEFFKDRPLFGVGFRLNSGFSHYYLAQKQGTEDVFSSHAHNVLLDFLSTTGLFGAMSWLLWMGLVIWMTVRVVRSKRPNFALGLCLAWVVFLLNGLTQVNFWEGKVIHQVMWMVAWILLWNHDSIET